VPGRERLGPGRRRCRKEPPARRLDRRAAWSRGRQRAAAAGLEPHGIRTGAGRRPRHPVLGFELRRRATGRVARAGRDRPARTAARRHRPRPQRSGAAHLAVPARPPHRRVWRSDAALPRLNAMTMPAGDPLSDQPVARVRRADIEYVLLGTAHVSRVSADAVRAMLDTEPFDAVAIELCDPRYQAMIDPEAYRRLDLFEVI